MIVSIIDPSAGLCADYPEAEYRTELYIRDFFSCWTPLISIAVVWYDTG